MLNRFCLWYTGFVYCIQVLLMVCRFCLWYTCFVYVIQVLFMVYRFCLWYTGFELFLEKNVGFKISCSFVWHNFFKIG